MNPGSVSTGYMSECRACFGDDDNNPTEDVKQGHSVASLHFLIRTDEALDGASLEQFFVVSPCHVKAQKSVFQLKIRLAAPCLVSQGRFLYWRDPPADPRYQPFEDFSSPVCLRHLSVPTG